jgi:phosphohistidine phosphatase
MELLIVRHAIAVEPGTPGVTDSERPLTEEGAAKFRESAQGLAALLSRPDVLLTSPFVRARQTAEIAAAAWGKTKPTLEPRLEAGATPAAILTAVQEHQEAALVAVFGHEPDCSGLLAQLLGTRHDGRLAFKKGGAALVDLGDDPGRSGQLVWLMPPRVLRLVGAK